MDTREENPTSAFVPMSHKPGKDFFLGTLFSLMILFLDVVINYNGFTRPFNEDEVVDIDLNHFKSA